MALILSIDTALENASICLSENDQPISLAQNPNSKNHATWLHTAIDEILKQNNVTLQNLSAIATSIGPGSYTGLRVGLSAAKGICYALNIPLIAINSLYQIAFAAKEEEGDLICPMIDARRMEVYAALYNKQLKELKSPTALVLNQESFAEELASCSIIFTGTANNKLSSIINQTNAVYSASIATAAHLAVIANNQIIRKHFSQVAYIEPLYLKEFYTSGN